MHQLPLTSYFGRLPSTSVAAASAHMRRRRAVRFGLSALFSLLMLLAGGCRSHRIPYPSREGQDSVDIIFDRTLSAGRRHLLKISREWIGTPYEYAHADKGKGTDCSGMVLAVYLEATDLKLPRNSAKQAEFCKKVKGNDVVPGDLVFFATGKDPSKVSHVGIMLDSENFIHASSSKGVCISSLLSPYYKRTFLSFGRVPGMD